MKIYGSKKEAEKDVVKGTLLVKDDVMFQFDLNCNWHIIARNINALNIKAIDIKAHDIVAHDIDAINIVAHKIDALYIDAYNIKAHNIDVNDIEFYGYAIAYKTFKCKSIVSKTENARYLCLDSEVIITGE